MSRLSTVFLSVVIAVAVMGYFVGLSDGVPKPDGLRDSPLHTAESLPTTADDAKLIQAVSYAQVPDTPMGPTATQRSQGAAIPAIPYDLYTKIEPSEAEKVASGKLRASRRAFNGAPPVVPHPIENTNDAACYACHSNGMKMAGLKASVMSHPFLGNCTQCHAPMAPKPFRDAETKVGTTFVGLPAPKRGERAFPGAPPTIPHSQWMRQNCSACHGGPNGWAGLESTHPWRTNCTQCHAPSASLDQAVPATIVPMLPPLDVVGR